MKILYILILCAEAFSLRCFEGKLWGLENNTRTDEKDCGGISHYCIQRINRLKNEISRECSSWSDEYSMEEKCPYLKLYIYIYI
uniref:Uncharacterized protein n=1 Tax=Heterorhabditis bacteriophora TaxID=37862 RepID=A0A1I7X8B3_HETBA